MNQKAIGIFDSGIGGLYVLKEIAALLPNEDLIYLGDTARFPYGTKPKQAVAQFSIENTKWLLEKKAKMIVIACNTSSAIAGEKIRSNSPVPVVTMADIPQVSPRGNIGLIATKHTIDSWAYPRAKTRRACPTLIELVERNCTSGEETEQEVAQSLQGLGNLDTLILGCTHYSALLPVIQRHTSATIFDPAQAVARQVKLKLTQLALLNDNGRGKVEYIFTGKRR